MAEKVLVTLVDDIDGSDADETVKFGLDGAEYEIDVSAGNATRLREALEEFVANARRRKGRVTRSGGERSQEEVQKLRAWAETAGMDLPARGRISSDVWKAFDARGKHGTRRAGPAGKKR